MKKQLNLFGFNNSQIQNTQSPSEQKMKVYLEDLKYFVRRLKIKRAQLMDIINNPDSHWKMVKRKSSTGYVRVCYSPSDQLRSIQRKCWLYMVGSKYHSVRERFENIPLENGKVKKPHLGGVTLSTAYERRNSIIENAKRHRFNKSALWMGITNAYASITTRHLQRFLNKHGFSQSESWILSKVFTYRGKLRQGAPRSGHIFNMMMTRIDVEIAKLVGAPLNSGQWKSYQRQMECHTVDKNGKVIETWQMRQSQEYLRRHRTCPVYTRYGDDIVVSFPGDNIPEGIREKAENVLSRHGFKINPSKARVSHNGVLELPGVLIIRGLIRPNKKYCESLKAKLSTDSLDEYQLKGHKNYLKPFGISIDKLVAKTT